MRWKERGRNAAETTADTGASQTSVISLTGERTFFLPAIRARERVRRAATSPNPSRVLRERLGKRVDCRSISGRDTEKRKLAPQEETNGTLGLRSQLSTRPEKFIKFRNERSNETLLTFVSRRENTNFLGKLHFASRPSALTQFRFNFTQLMKFLIRLQRYSALMSAAKFESLFPDGRGRDARSITKLGAY